MTAFALTLILVLLLASTRTQAFQDLNDSLLESIANGDFLRVRHLLAQGADPNCFDKRGFSALLFATEKGDTQIVTSLVDAGAEIEAVEKEGNTALHFAADKGHIEICTILLQAGADPTLRNLYARSPVNIASENEHPEIVKLVEDFDYRELELIDASAKGALERMDEILASGPLFIDAANEDGWTALIFAVDRGHRESARKLLKAGADVNIAENTGWTPLMFATYDKDVEMQQILTNFGAAPQYLRRRTHHRL